MLNGQYVGCTTGFSQSDKTDIFIPNQKVETDTTPYLQRLVAVDLIKVEQTGEPLVVGEPTNTNNGYQPIQCTPTFIEVDNTQAVPTGIYSLKVQINDQEPQIFTQDSNDNPYPDIPFTPAKVLMRMMQRVNGVFASGGGGEYWLEPIIVSRTFRNTERAITFGGLIENSVESYDFYLPTFHNTRSNQNRLIVSSANDGNLDLFKFLAKNDETSITLHSCAVGYFGGE